MSEQIPVFDMSPRRRGSAMRRALGFCAVTGPVLLFVGIAFQDYGATLALAIPGFWLTAAAMVLALLSWIFKDRV